MNWFKDPRTNWKYILIVVILAAIAGGWILGYQFWWVAKQEVKAPEIKLPEKITQDKTANWKIYSNEKYGFEIKYPDDFKIDEFPGEVVFYKGEKLTIPPGSVLDPYPIALVIYNRGKDCGDCSVFTLENITIAGYHAVKAITNNQLTDYLWITGERNTVRINYGAHDKEDKVKSDVTFNQMLSTFKFIETEEIATKEETCVNSGGTVETSLCCESASDFLNLCLIGPCGCGPQNSHQIKTCDCGPDRKML
jgi:hypothetical protein